MSAASAGERDPATAIEALRARGADRSDPVRFSYIEALARRAAAHRGQTRRLLDDKLERLLAACSDGVKHAATTAPVLRERAPSRDTLADLLAHIARNAEEPLEGVPAGKAATAPPNVPGPAELKAVRYYRSTWSRLSVDQRMTQSLATVAENAGPLNTQRLLHQALTTMREASPEYLHRFMSHVEALLWLEPARLSGVAAKKDPARSTRSRKPAHP